MSFTFKTQLLFLIIFLSVSVRAQRVADVKAGDKEFNQFQTLYKSAQAFKDTNSMITAMVGMAAIRPRDTVYLKSLTKLYFARQNFLSAVIAGHKYIDLVPDDVDMVQLTAISSESVRNYDYALLLYTELYYRTKKPEYKYFAAYMEYELFRKEDCLKTINFCLQLPGIDTKMMDVKSADGHSQSVPLRAVCMYLMGLEYIDMKEVVKAKSAFQEALKIFPNFTVAQESLVNAGRSSHK